MADRTGNDANLVYWQRYPDLFSLVGHPEVASLITQIPPQAGSFMIQELTPPQSGLNSSQFAHQAAATRQQEIQGWCQNRT